MMPGIIELAIKHFKHEDTYGLIVAENKSCTIQLRFFKNASIAILYDCSDALGDEIELARYNIHDEEDLATAIIICKSS